MKSPLSELTNSPTSSRAEISVNPTKSLNTTATSSYRSAISSLAGVQPLDDRLGQDVEQQRSRPCLLDLELATDPVEESQVGVADGLDVLELCLESPDPAPQLEDFLLERLGRRIRGRRIVVHVPRRRVTNVSLK